MTIKVTYNVTDIYVSENVSATYINVSYEVPSDGGGAVWGDITGTLSDQADLQLVLDGKVPYTGATTNVNLGEFELKAGQMTLDTSPTGTAAVGTTRWNDTIGSSETTLKGGSVILKNGVDLVARVVNKVNPNTTLTKAAYQAVRVSGAQGQRLAIELAQANNDNNSADTIGLVTETIAANQEGFIMTVGSLEGINTTGSLQGETWVDGDVLYLSPTIAGRITNVKPIAPQHLVVIGYVEYAHANNGKIYVKVMNGWELGELHDVDTTGATNGQVLKYNGTIWTPSGDVGITSLNGLNATTQTFATGTSGTDFNISSATSTHTFNLPTASGTNRGLLSSADWTTFNNKQNALTNPITGTGASGQVAYFTGATTQAGSANFIFDATNNRLRVGGGADTGQRLQVTGDTLLKGSGNTNATTALNVQNSDGNAAFRVLNNGAVNYGTVGVQVNAMSVSSRTTSITGGGILLYSNDISSNGTSVLFLGASITGTTSGNRNNIQVQQTFAPTSGFTTYNDIILNPTINQTGGANGITRGLYVNPTLTAAADWRSIEWSNNTGWGLYGAGSARNYLGGNLGINVAPSAWAGGINALQIGNTAFRGSSTSGGFSNNAYYDGTDWRYLLSTFATDHLQNAGSHTWRYAPSGTAGGVITWQNFMTLNTSGNLGIGSSNSNISSLYITKDISGAAISYGILNQGTVQPSVTSFGINNQSESNIAASTTLTNYVHYNVNHSILGAGSTVTNVFGFRVNSTNTIATNNYGFYGDIAAATGRWNLYMNGTALNYMNGALLLGSTTSTGEQLQVTGTAKITGASSFGGNMTVSLNQNAVTSLTISNTTDGTTSGSAISLTSDAASGTLTIGKRANLRTAYKILGGSDAQIYNSSGADISILNDAATGQIKMAAGGSSTAQMTLTSAGNLCVGVTSGGDFLNIAAATTAKAQINLAAGVAPTTPANGDIWFDGTDLKMRIGGVTKTFTLV